MSNFFKVKEFMQKFKQEVKSKPSLPDDNIIKLRINLIKEELLIPTKIYQKILSPLVSNKIISGLSHITGGGITENLPRILPKNLSFKIDLEKWEMPKLMSWIIKKSDMSEDEALKTFNCGIGMICVVSKNNLQTFIDYFKNKNEDFYLIGEITNTKSHSYKGNLF